MTRSKILVKMERFMLKAPPEAAQSILIKFSPSDNRMPIAPLISTTGYAEVSPSPSETTIATSTQAGMGTSGTGGSTY